MSDKLYIGQHVRVKKDTSEVQLEGKVGVIVGGNDTLPLVEFYDDFGGHEGALSESGLLRKECNCWSVGAKNLEPLSKTETALYALGVREGVPFNIKCSDGYNYEYGPYTMENGTVYDCNHDDLCEDEVAYLFRCGIIPAEADEKQQALAKINDLSYELRELADELSNLRSEIEGA